MPVTKSAKKALRQSQKRALINLRIKKQKKKAIKAFRLSPTIKNLMHVSSVLDQAAKKGVIHKRKADRLKSQFSKSSESPGAPQKKTKKSSKK